MRPDIKKNVFHLCWSPDKKPVLEVSISLSRTIYESSQITLSVFVGVVALGYQQSVTTLTNTGKVL